MVSLRKGNATKGILLLGLLLFELLTLATMELYKYYVNRDAGFGTGGFVRQFFSSFDVTYAGNLIWIILFFISLVSLINIFRSFQKVKDSSLAAIFLIYTFSFVLLAISIILPSSDVTNNTIGKFFQFSAKGAKTLLLSLFFVIKIFLTLSLAIIAFSALRKYYFFRSIWLTILTIAVAFCLVIILVYYYKDDYQVLMNEKKTADAGVILGAAVWGGNRPSPVLRERINKGYELYKNGITNYLVLTGGGAPGEMTEAEVAKNELEKKGIDPKFIFVENKSNSTLEQITFINKNLYRKNNWKEIILITDNFHLLRSKEMCRFFGINASTVASDTPLSTESSFSFSVKESFAVILFWLFGIG